MVTVKYQGRLGNNLFQYCLGRIISQQLGFYLDCTPLHGFPNTFNQVYGQKCYQPKEIISDNNIDFESLLRTKNKPRNIILNGFFQNYKFFFPFRDEILKWLSLEQSLKIIPSSKDLVVNVRRSDYIQLGWALPFSYYEKAIMHSCASNIYIVTDDTWDPFFLRFRKFNPTFFKSSAIDQIGFMKGFKSIVMSQSSFSWWGAFLGSATKIYCPIPLSGIWAPGPDNPTKLIPEDDTFIKIPCLEDYSPNSIELIYQYIRLKYIKTYNKVYYRLFHTGDSRFGTGGFKF